MVKEIEGNLCFFHFRQKFENSKWPPFLGRRNFFFLNCQEYIDQIPCGSKISPKSQSRTVKEIEANLCISIFGEVAK